MKLLFIGSGVREHALVWRLAQARHVTRFFHISFSVVFLLLICGVTRGQSPPPSTNLRVGAAAVELEADDAMVIAGGIHAGKASGQEGRLRCVAVVIEKAPVKLAIVACDVLMLTRESLDRAIDKMRLLLGDYPDVAARLAQQTMGSFFLINPELTRLPRELRAAPSLMKTEQVQEHEIAALACATATL